MKYHAPLCENTGPLKRDHLAGNWLSGNPFSQKFTNMQVHLPTSHPTCREIPSKGNPFSKHYQHAGNSGRAKQLSRRYKIEVTKLKTITSLKFVLIFFTRNIKKRKCSVDETPCSPLKVVKCTLHKSTKKHKQMKKKKRQVCFMYVPALV